MKQIVLIFIHLFISIYANAILDKFQEKFYNVDKLEIYITLNNVQKLIDVKYFEGKISIKQNGNEIKCISGKTGKEYLNFKNLDDGTYRIISTFCETCIGIFEINTLDKSVLVISLKDENTILKYYLTRLFTDDEIYTKITSGTGVVINKNTILTNYHVVNNSQKLSIEFQNKVLNGSVVKIDESLDIALIRIDEDILIKSQFLSFANYDISIGMQTYACGFPLLSTMGKQLKITSGIISSQTGFNDDDKYLQTTAPVDPGNSGGPLIDEYGNIIGIISAKHSSGTNVGYALKIKSLVKKTFITKVTTNKKPLSIQQIYDKAKNTLCIIKCFSL